MYITVGEVTAGHVAPAVGKQTVTSAVAQPALSLLVSPGLQPLKDASQSWLFPSQLTQSR